MTPETVFSLANVTAAGGWALLVFLPRQRWTATVSGIVLPIAFAVLYVAALVAGRGTGGDGDFSTLAGVATLFRGPWLLLAGWIHYLAFDLLVGNWEARDARARGIPHLLLVPCLILTFLFGPAGWLMYLGVRSVVPAGPLRGTRPARQTA
jgi:hypothetical protein